MTRAVLGKDLWWWGGDTIYWIK